MIACFLGRLVLALLNALKMFFVPCTTSVLSNHSDCDPASRPSDPPILDDRPLGPQPIAPVGCLFRRLLTFRHPPAPNFGDDLEAQMSSEESSLEFTPIDSFTSLDYQDSVSQLDRGALNGLDVDSSQQLSVRINVSPAPSDSGVILSDNDSDLMHSASSEASETHYYDFSDEQRESDISTPHSNNSDVGDDLSCPELGESTATPVSTYVPPRNRRILQDFSKFETVEVEEDITRARSLSPPPLHHTGLEKSLLLNKWDGELCSAHNASPCSMCQDSVIDLPMKFPF